MGPPSYMRSVVDRNVVMPRIPVFGTSWGSGPLHCAVVGGFVYATAKNTKLESSKKLKILKMVLPSD